MKGFREWATSDYFPEHLRVAFLNEEIYLDMSNEELETHNKVKMEIGRLLLNWNRETQRGTFCGDGVLLTHEAAGVSNNPDAFFFSHDALRAGRVRLVPRQEKRGQYIEIEGTPDWVLEVVSAGSVQKDTVQLREAYHRAGIPEYWIIDARGDEIVFQILHYRKNGYAAATRRGGWQRSRVFGRSFRLERQRDALGLWEYTLHVQAGK
jgi:Uma2 family endonuclease